MTTGEIMTMDGPIKVRQMPPDLLEELKQEVEDVKREADTPAEVKERPVQLVDHFAQMYLRDWIPTGFPTQDPEQQIRLAYSYAQLQIKIREEFLS